ncbi:MAG: MBL fold metallo-hydrolase [Coprococcus sp.]
MKKGIIVNTNKMEGYYIDKAIVGTCFLIKGKQAVLFDPGMAYYAGDVIKKVKDILNGQPLDAVFLTHSHYDHVAAVPYIRQEWPDIKVYAAEYACHIFEKPKAKKMMYHMSVEAALEAGREWREDYRDDLLYADVALHDGDIIRIGEMSVQAIETIGHTQCSMSFLIDGDTMVSSETIGLEGDHGSGYLPAFLISYKQAVISLQKTKAANPKQIYLPHRGLALPDDRFWEHMEKGLASTKHVIIKILAEHDRLEDQLVEMEEIFWKKATGGTWPKEAFDINATAMLNTIAAEFPEELEQEKNKLKK